MQFFPKLMLVMAGFIFGFQNLSAQSINSDPNCGFDQEMEQLMKEHPEMRTARQRYLEEVIPSIIREAKNNPDFRNAPVLTIPVVFHIIHKGEAVGSGQNIPISILEAQMVTLNEDYAALNANYNSTPSQFASVIGNPEIKFCIATIDPNGMPTNGITRHEYQNVTKPSIKSTIKPATFWDTNKYMNVWSVAIPGTTSAGGNTGYAYLPYFGTVGSNFDGIVCDYRWMGANQGTLTHEAGHYLGLFHPWGNGGCGNDDGLNDTPTCEGPARHWSPCSGGFPAGNQSCGNEQMYINFMDYSTGSCTTSFTQEQIAVMRATLMGTTANPSPESWASRNGLLQSAAIVATACATNPGGGGGGGILDPDPIVITNDAGITAVAQPDGTYCPFTEITPEVTLVNQYGEDNLTSVTIKYYLNNGAATTFNWTGNLEKGESEEVTLPSSNTPGNAFVIKVITSNPNGQDDDLTLNDEYLKEIDVIEVKELPFEENFEGSKFEPTTNGITSTNNPSDFVRWKKTNVSGFGTGDGSIFFNNRYTGSTSPAGTKDTIFTPFLDFTTLANPRLKFDVAYALGVDLTKMDGLEVLISTECGGAFTRIFYKEGMDLSTRYPLFNMFVPTASEWRQEKIELAQYANEMQVRIAFVNHSAGGNAIYLDNINLKVGCDGDVTSTSQNLSCGGDCSGSIDLTVTGIDNFTVSWSDPNLSGLSQTGLCAGVYSATVSDGGFCTFVHEFELEQPAEISFDLWSGNETSNGGNDGEAKLTNISGGGNNKTIEWSTGETTETISNLIPGDYDVTISDGSCEIVATFTIYPYECAFDATVILNQPTCPGNGGAIGMNLTGGAGNYDFVWDPPHPFGSVPSRNPAPPGAYSITVTDALGCSVVVNALVEEPTLEYNEVITYVSSFNGNDGSIMIAIEGQNGTANYSWSNGESTASISGLAPGIYTLTIVDDACTYIKEFEIENIECELEFSVSGSNISCAGQNDGIGSVAIIGGRDPYNITWSNAQTGALATNLAPGDYTVTIVDDNGCVGEDQITIEEPSAMNVNLTSMDVTVQNGSNGSITTTVSGGVPNYTYKWNYQGATVQSLTNLIAGDYSLTVTDENGCTVVKTITITQPFCPEIDIVINTTPASCNGENDGVATISLPGSGYFVEWSNSDVGASADNLEPGVHSVTITDSEDCVYEETFSISEPSALSINISMTSESSAGTQDGTATASVTGGSGVYTYSWSNAKTTQTISNLTAGTYVLTVTDENDCSIVEEIVVTAGEDACGSFEATITANIPCSYDEGILTLVPSGGTGPYSYLWSVGGVSSSVLTVLESGQVSGTITDGNNCEAITSFMVEIPDMIQVSVNTTNETAVAAADGTASVSASGGVGSLTYIWSPNNETSTSISGLTAGSYTVTITDENECAKIEVFTISTTTSGCASFMVDGETTDVLCANAETGAIDLTVSGGDAPYTFVWNIEEFVDEDLENIGAGTYLVTVTDVNECVITKTFMINEPEPLVVESTLEMNNCFGDEMGSIQLELSGESLEYSFSWSGSDATTPGLANLPAGEYVVTITDENNCETVETFEITQPDEIEIFVEKTNQENQGEDDGTISIIPSGGVSPYTASWDNDMSGNDLTGLAPGVYTVTVTDANDCEKVLEIEILEADNLCQNFSLEVSGENILCFENEDGSATATATGGTTPYLYSWSNQETTETINDLGAGTYQVTVLDANDCESIGAIQLIEPDQLNLELTSTRETVVGQADGTATATVTGGTAPYIYLWGNGSTEATATGFSAGSTTVLVKDANGCEIDGEVTIGSGDPDCSSFAVEFEASPVSCNGNKNGMIILEPVEGDAPYTYKWSTGDDDSELSGLSGGLYIATVTDANNCEVVVNILITEPAILVVKIDAQNGSCGKKGYASAIVAGGTGPFVYEWNTSASNKTIVELGSGEYSVVVTDANDCTAEANVVLEVEEYEELIENTIQATSCFGSNDGMIEVLTSGGHQPYVFEWSNDENTPVIENLEGGVYTVFITDGNGCETIQTFEVKEPSKLDVVILVDDQSNGLVNVTAGASGGTAPYTYLWDNGITDVSLDNVQMGSYTVTVTDANGCVQDANVIATDNKDLENIIGFSITPNPTRDLFILEVDLSSNFDAKIGIYDLLGQKVYYKNTFGSHINQTIDVSQLAPGTYYVNFSIGTSNRTEKLVVIK